MADPGQKVLGSVDIGPIRIERLGDVEGGHGQGHPGQTIQVTSLADAGTQQLVEFEQFCDMMNSMFGAEYL